MPIKINGSSSGSVTLAAPASGSDITVNLPASAGTIAIQTGYQFVQSIYYTSSGTFSKASYPWLRAIRVRCQGAGGGGAGGIATGAGGVSVGGGGAGGTYAESFITDIAGLASSVTVTVGSGGAAATGAASASAGGTSSFGSAVIAQGGGGGASDSFAGNAWSNGPGDISGGTGDIVVPGTASTPTLLVLTNPVVMCPPGGTSVLGGNQRGFISAGANGFGGIGYGGGGGAGGNSQNQATARTGGTGAAGIVIVELYA